jgi:catechol 2,3-dioxygenase-like lactoylglutathione lyase family enzyme
MEAISPFFIVSNVDQTIAFYRDKLGFETRFQQPDQDPFFAIVGRDGAQLFVKSDKDTSPLPNPSRNPSMRWDAYVYVPDPMRSLPNLPITAQHSAYLLRILTTVCVASRFATLMATYCSSADQNNGCAAIHPASCVSSPVAIAMGPTFRSTGETRPS